MKRDAIDLGHAPALVVAVPWPMINFQRLNGHCGGAAFAHRLLWSPP